MVLRRGSRAETSGPFYDVNSFHEDFFRADDAEVHELLERASSIGGPKPAIQDALSRFRVRAARFAESDRSAGLLFRAALLACLESDDLETVVLGSFLRALTVARERFRDGFSPSLPRSKSCLALRRVASEVFPFAGGGSFTPARRAFERPIAIACLAERAPWSPLRICSISSRTNSPAWVLADFPSRRSRATRLMVFCSGIYGIRPRCQRRMACEDDICDAQSSYGMMNEKLVSMPSATDLPLC